MGMSPFFLVPGTRYLHLNLKSEVGGPAKAMGFCGYGSGFEPRHSLQKRRADLRQTFFFGIRRLFQCSPEVNSGCAKVFASGENTCTAHLRRPALRGPMVWRCTCLGISPFFLIPKTARRFCAGPFPFQSVPLRGTPQFFIIHSSLFIFRQYFRTKSRA